MARWFLVLSLSLIVFLTWLRISVWAGLIAGGLVLVALLVLTEDSWA